MVWDTTLVCVERARGLYVCTAPHLSGRLFTVYGRSFGAATIISVDTRDASFSQFCHVTRLTRDEMFLGLVAGSRFRGNLVAMAAPNGNVVAAVREEV